MSPEGLRKRATGHPALRTACAQDGAAMWRLVRQMGGLELNSAYFYMLYCIDFADTCVVAELDGELAGFVLGHRPPKRPDSVFVWQVGVAPGMRQQGLARRLLDELVTRQRPAVRFLEASVTPDNQASRKLFGAFAREHHTVCRQQPFMEADLFPARHEAEDLLRIGPLPNDQPASGSP